MPSFDRERLLKEVIEDAKFREFRAQTYKICRAELRRGRRTLTLGLALAAALVLLAAILQVPRRTQTANPIAAAPNAIFSDPRPITPYVVTQPLQVFEVVRSVPDKSIIVETSRSSVRSMQVVRTRPTYVTPISDAQLLAYFAGQPAGFINSPLGKEFVLFHQRN